VKEDPFHGQCHIANARCPFRVIAAVVCFDCVPAKGYSHFNLIAGADATFVDQLIANFIQPFRFDVAA
jgi:hypothetical protein